MANRFYTPETLCLGPFCLDGAEAHHLSHVRRLSIGEEVVLFNGDGKEYRATIIAIAKREVELEVIAITEPARELRFHLHIGCALPKGDRLDFLVEKLTELGATDLTPLLTERSVAIAKESKIDKLKRAVIEASKQCGRNKLMQVHPPSTLSDWCESRDFPSVRWIAQPDGECISEPPPDTDGFAIAIGPEGGFTADEVAQAARLGFLPVDLGPRILRIETAALAIAAVVANGRLAQSNVPWRPKRSEARS